MNRYLNPPSPRTVVGICFFCLAVVLLLCGTGCVERLLKIRSEPPGADIFVNGRKVAGTTPLDHPFSFYGTVGIVLRREGHESRHIQKTLSPPWYEFFPLDFFAEFIVPWTLRDHHTVDARLEPVMQLEEDAGAREAAAIEKELKSEAEAERAKAKASAEIEEKPD